MSGALRRAIPTFVTGGGLGRRTQGVNRTSYRSGGGAAHASFFLNFNDLGAGLVNVTPGRGQVSATFTRATTAWTKLSSGLWASVASGAARSFYSGFDTAAPAAYRGYLAEGARTNQCLQARDLGTTWTPLNATLAKDQVGIDGVSNSASSMLATAIGGSCLQTITEAATLSALSLFIKRLVGVGTITIQQGASTLDVTASVNASTYTRVELDATVLNPAIGIVLGTSGDKIAVDMVQFENGAFASTPIPTTTIAVARNADVLTYPTTGWLNALTGSCAASGICLGDTGATARMLALDDGTDNERIGIQRASGGAGIGLAVVDGGVTQAFITPVAPGIGALVTNAAAWSSNDFAYSLNGAAAVTDSAGTVPAVTTLRFGTAPTGISNWNGTLASFLYYASRLSNAQLQALTS